MATLTQPAGRQRQATVPRRVGTHPQARRGRRAHLWLAAVGLAALLAGCSDGFNAQTDEIYQPGPGVSVRQDGVYLLNAAIITDGQGHGTLIGALVNQQPTADSVTAITVTGPGQAVPQVTIRGGTVALPSHQGVQLADTGPVRVTGTLDTGADYELIITFHDGAPITTTIPVLPQSADFKAVPVGPVPGAVGGSGASPTP